MLTTSLMTEQLSLWEDDTPPPAPAMEHTGPRVVHCKLAAPGSFIYIGRPSIFGNPHPMNSEAERAEALARYEEWLLHRLEQSASFRDEFEKLRGHDLGCWCKTAKQPTRACHGDILFKWLYGSGHPSGEDVTQVDISHYSL